MPRISAPHLKLNADQFRALRKSYGESQDKFATRTGLGRPLIAQIERGNRPCTAKTLKKLREGLKLTNAQIVERVSEYVAGKDAS